LNFKYRHLRRLKVAIQYITILFYDTLHGYSVRSLWWPPIPDRPGPAVWLGQGYAAGRHGR